MEILTSVLLSIAVGLIIGLLSGMLGVGGGTVLVPAYKLVYGMSAIASTATSLFTIIPTSISGVVTHIKNKTCIPRLGIASGIGGAVTSPLGVWLASVSPDWLIMVVAAVVIGYSAITMFGKSLKLWKKKKAAKTSSAASAEKAKDKAAFENLEEFEKGNPVKRQLLVGIAVGLCAGVISGYVGVGGGFIMVPMFMQILRTPMKLTSGTSLIAVMILAVPGTITQALLGNIDWMAGIMVAIGTVPGAAIGARILPKVPELALRFGFSIFLLIAALLLVLNN